MPARYIRRRGDRARSRQRRGVLLLLVLSLLVLFAIIGLTFVLVAGQFRRATRSEIVGDRYTIDPRTQLDSLARDVMRGTTNQLSPIQPHGLLEDMYGPPTLTGYLGYYGITTTAGYEPQAVAAYGTSPANAPFIDLMVTTTGLDPTPSNPYSYQTYGCLNGLVLTMLSGPAHGLSTRIVGSCFYDTKTFSNSNGAVKVVYMFMLRVMAFEGVSTPTIVSQFNAGVYNGTLQRFVINGRPFSGTGFGYNTSPYGASSSANSPYGQNGVTEPNAGPCGQLFPRASGAYTMLDATDVNGFYYALMPNAKYFQSLPNTTYDGGYDYYALPPVNLNGPLHNDPAGPGGANEDYDAPDAQNPHLAYMPIGVTNSSQIMPSFHRPDLVAWYQTNMGAAWTSNTGYIQEKVILRPLNTDHPLFTGGNPSFNPLTGPWDVDNDGDGIADSVWLDPGYSVLTGPDGSQYKMLVAYLILDLDGRLNVNAHGNLAQTQAFVPDPNTGGDPMSASYSQGPYALLSSSGAGGSPTGGAAVVNTSNPLQSLAQLRRGQGYGPAEINPGYGLTSSGGSNPPNPIFSSLQGYQQLMTGIASGANGLPYDGKYGEYGVAQTPLPGSASAQSSGAISQDPDNRLSQIKHYELPYGPAYGTQYYSYAGTPGSVFQMAFPNPANSSIPMTSYAAPFDFWGRMATALDFRGQPLCLFPNPSAFAASPNFLLWETPNNPYALNLLRRSEQGATPYGAPVDNPYTVAELERLLRRFDLDAYTLSDRLRAILENGTGPNPPLRQYITTDSYDVASPCVQPPTEMRQLLVNEAMIQEINNSGPLGSKFLNSPLNPYGFTTGQNSAARAACVQLNVADLLRAKLMNPVNGLPTTAAFQSIPTGTAANMLNAQIAAVNQQLVMMLPPELAAGQLMNLNRPFGNGRDDNNNLVVDEPQEYFSSPVNQEASWKGLFPPSTTASVNFMADNLLDSNDDVPAGSSTSALLSASYSSVATMYGIPSGLASHASVTFARQLYARHLYVLMMLLVDQGYVQPSAFISTSGLNSSLQPWAPGTSSYSQWENGSNWGNVPGSPGGEFPATGSPSQMQLQIQQELIARRIAQWAINVADFRDPDGIMTPFEYDVNPFDGWNVDGIVDTVEDSTASITKKTTYADGNGNPMIISTVADPNSQRRVVWGCEYPELMLTETFATHDRRVRDTANDLSTSGTPQANHSRYHYNAPSWQLADQTMDQTRIPQGSLFVELFCPRPNNGTQTALPAELYSYTNAKQTGQQPQLDLGRMCPDTVAVSGSTPTPGTQNPVWRLVVTGSTRQALNNPNSNNVYQRMLTNPLTTCLDPPDGAGPVANAAGTSYPMYSFNFSIWSQNPFFPQSNGYNYATIDRIVWFTPTPPQSSNHNYSKIYYNQGTTQNGTALMNPGSYALIGPRPLTVFGRATSNGYSPAPLPALSPQSIQILPTVSYTSTNGTLGTPAPSYPTVNTNIQQPLGIVCGAPKPTTAAKLAASGAATAWNGGNTLSQVTKYYNATSMSGPGVSVSEPYFGTYYPEPTYSDTTVTTTYPGLIDAYGQDSGAGSNTKPFLDQPFESLYGAAPLTSNAAFNSNTSATAAGVPLVLDVVASVNLGLPGITSLATGTTPQYKTLILQRVANPLLPYNPMPNDPNEPTYKSTLPVNPYISIDWMPINLTVFNGEQIPGQAPALATPPPNPGGVDPDDLQFYSGSLSTSNTGPQSGGPTGPLATAGTPLPPAITPPNTATVGSFYTVQRGITNTIGGPSPTTDLNIWPQWFDLYPPAGSGLRGTNGSTNVPPSGIVFDWNLDNVSGPSGGPPSSATPPNATSTATAYYAHTLGYLNRAFLGVVQSPNVNGNAIGNFGPPWSGVSGLFLGDPVPQTWLMSSSGGGNLNRTIPWITWNNRPFVSHYELMQVPASSPSRLMWEFGFSASGTNVNPYDATNPNGLPINPFLTPFMHLLNFELSTSASNVRRADGGVAPHFYRLFDYVQVPSRFVGTETVLNPNFTSAQFNEMPTPGAITPPEQQTPAQYKPYNGVNMITTAICGSQPAGYGANMEKALFSYLHPPFNTVSKHRDPGKVNINTISHQAGDQSPIIWNAIVNDAPIAGGGSQTMSGPQWLSVFNSIHNGQQSPTAGVTPSWFANPFRTSAGADLQLPPGLPIRGVDATLLRPFSPPGFSMLPGTPSGNPSPNLLFDFPPAEVTTSGGFQAQAYNAPDRNSYFRYQNLQRMGNLVTTRSNVYAIWVTVGYFRALPWNTGPDFVHPDGYQLAEEMGSDGGTVQRHRGFYIFDRSIPVASERGVDHNVEKAILIKRFIE